MTERKVAILTSPGTQILDVAGPMEVFSTANRFRPSGGYRTQLLSARGGAIVSSSGLEFSTTPVAEVPGPFDTVLVAGGPSAGADTTDAHLLLHLRRLAGGARRITSVCSGAFLLAAAGLLDGRRATTHWRLCSLLQREYPRVIVDADAIYVHDGQVWTSAGVTAGIDLALALVADDHGTPVAAEVARQLVVYLRRSGGQTQFSAFLAAQALDNEPVRDLLSWLPEHLDDDLSVAALARRLNLSERQFRRLFNAQVGVTPAVHVEGIRVEAACRLLETTHGSIGHIAALCGFGAPETMNRTFRRRLGTTPGEHRRHFGPMEEVSAAS
jgi:transcriptional regulator GlxA family with amidase domain